jgi:hypothetical protein
VSVFQRGESGRVSFASVLEVRRCKISGCPENAIEIVTPGRIYSVVPVDDSDDDSTFDRWMRELSNAADVYGADIVEAQKAETKRKEEEAKADAERRAAVLTSVVKSGMLHKQGAVVKKMKQRFFVVIGHTLTYYAKEDDLVNEDADAIGSIDLRTVSRMRHPSENAGASSKSYSFDMHAGERIWCLAAANNDDLRAWMKALAKATGKLKLKDESKDGVQVLTTTNPKAKLTARLSSYGAVKGKKGKGKKKKVGGRNRRQSARPESKLM